MDSLFSFLAKFIGAPARVSAPFALAALVISALRRAGIELFAASDILAYQIIILAGFIGFCEGVVADPNWTPAFYANTYYEVPDYVWEVIDIYSNLPVPKSPPWVNRA